MYSTVKNFFKALKETFMGLPTKWKVFTVVIIGLFALWKIATDKPDAPPPPQTYNYSDIDVKLTQVSLYDRSKREILEKLKAPKSAEFAPFRDAQILVQQSDSTVVVVSYVDAQNALGVSIRSDYYCKYKYFSGDPSSSYSYSTVESVIK